MQPVAIMGLVSFATLLVVVILLATPRRRPPRSSQERSLEAQADIEDSDIDQMIEARNAIRRRRGAPEIGDDLLAELRRDLDRADGER